MKNTLFKLRFRRSIPKDKAKATVVCPERNE